MQGRQPYWPSGCSVGCSGSCCHSLGKFSKESRLRMILVTGATGKTGRELVQRLISRSMPVRALVRDRARADDIAAAGAEVAVADLSRSETLGSALVGIDKVYLMTAADPQQVMLHSNSSAPPSRRASGILFATPSEEPISIRP
jgi:hypothetical protein